MLTRRNFLKASALGVGAIALNPVFNNLYAAGTGTSSGIPRRFIFIRKSSGIRPLEAALPTFSAKEKAIDEKKEPFTADLDKHELPKWLQGLEEHKSNMAILQGLSCKMSENVHFSFSSVMGCFKSNRNTLSAIKRTTVDFELAKLFPSENYFGSVSVKD